MRRILLASLLASTPLCSYAQIIPFGNTPFAATGSTTPRSAPDRAADVANVLDYGADPTGVADSAPAINSAIAASRFSTIRTVYIPAGTYHLAHSITVGSLTQSQCLVGDGHSTIIDINSDFDPTATSVVNIVGNTNTRPCVNNIHFRFHQPSDITTTTTASSLSGATTITVASVAGVAVGDYVVDATTSSAIISWKSNSQTAISTTVTNITGNVVTLSTAVEPVGVGSGDTIGFSVTRSGMKTLSAGCTTTQGGTGCKYPWAIYGLGMGVPLIDHVIIEGAWDGLYLHGDSLSTNSITLDDVAVGALDVGLDVDDIHNFPHIYNYEFWGGFGFVGDTAFDQIYYDDTTVCANLGAIDGLSAIDFQCWTGKLNLLSSWTFGQFLNLQMDGNFSDVNVASSGGWVQMSNFYSTKAQSSTTISPFVVSSGNVFLSNPYMTNAGGVTDIQVTGGELHIVGGSIFGIETHTANTATVSGGVLDIENSRLDANASCSNGIWAVQSGTGVLKFKNNNMVEPCTNKAAVFIQTDVAGNDVTGNYWNGWLFDVMGASFTSSPQGVYGLNGWPKIHAISSGSSDTMRVSDAIINWDSSSGAAKSETLLACSAPNAGESVTVLDEFGDAGTHNITITPSAGTINGAASAVINTNHGSASLVCDGVSNWVSR